jgi:hypothetical protein
MKKATICDGRHTSEMLAAPSLASQWGKRWRTCHGEQFQSALSHPGQNSRPRTCSRWSSSSCHVRRRGGPGRGRAGRERKRQFHRRRVHGLCPGRSDHSARSARYYRAALHEFMLRHSRHGESGVRRHPTPFGANTRPAPSPSDFTTSMASITMVFIG